MTLFKNKAEAYNDVRERRQFSLRDAALNTLVVKKLSDTAKLPTRDRSSDLGYDLYSDQAYIVLPGQQVLIETNIAVGFPRGYGALIRDRSGVATKQNLAVVAGVIDNEYVGPIKIAMWNLGLSTVTIERGVKIAQMLLYAVPPMLEIVEVEELGETSRGSNGFGSSGN